MEGQKLEAAAAAAGMSERTARTWQEGPLPSAKKKDRWWRTRADPFAEVWETEIEPMLRLDEEGELQATTVMAELCRRLPGKFEPSQVRTLQRHLRRWRAMHGPDKEVFFPQEHQPGHLGAFDFTHCGELKITIGGVAFVHLLFQFVLAWSGWRYVSLALGETYEALLAGLQGAVDTLLVDGLVRGVGRGTVALGRRLRHTQTGRVQTYLVSMVLGAVLIVLVSLLLA